MFMQSDDFSKTTFYKYIICSAFLADSLGQNCEL